MDNSLLSRIDRAVADNIQDIQRSFGAQAGIVQDFIVFISKRLKTDLFGYTRFTIQDFCKHTGRRRQELALIHPDFVSGKSLPPVIQGFAFQTVLDFALYTMLERNLIFSSSYSYKMKDAVVQLHSFPILKDLKLNFVRSSNEQKIYDIRVSDELMNGFLSRYYTLNAECYRIVGKGRGGDSRKKLVMYLSKLAHVLASSGTFETVVPLDRLCRFADINDLRPAHKKQNLARMLAIIVGSGGFGLDFSFVSQPAYAVKLVFKPAVPGRVLQVEHLFYHRLLTNLKALFDSLYSKGKHIPGSAFDEDPFQLWLVSSSADPEAKAQVLSQAYYLALNLNVSTKDALSMIRSGNFIALLAVR
ncbi:hypothetical protein [Pedobacter sp. GR22-6]|uniref:hypothetical protein n=1 Tax=Pedobacter sp. GR22-6 TaxID=3127957 RepID=UPI00307DD9FE